MEWSLNLRKEEVQGRKMYPFYIVFLLLSYFNVVESNKWYLSPHGSDEYGCGFNKRSACASLSGLIGKTGKSDIVEVDDSDPLKNHCMDEPWTSSLNLVGMSGRRTISCDKLGGKVLYVNAVEVVAISLIRVVFQSGIVHVSGTNVSVEIHNCDFLYVGFVLDDRTPGEVYSELTSVRNQGTVTKSINIVNIDLIIVNCVWFPLPAPRNISLFERAIQVESDIYVRGVFVKINFKNNTFNSRKVDIRIGLRCNISVSDTVFRGRRKGETKIGGLRVDGNENLLGSVISVKNCSFLHLRPDEIIFRYLHEKHGSITPAPLILRHNNATIVIDNCTFIQNQGAIDCLIPTYGTLIIIRCKFKRNFSLRNGGAVRLNSALIDHTVSGPIILIQECSFIENVAGTFGILQGELKRKNGTYPYSYSGYEVRDNRITVFRKDRIKVDYISGMGGAFYIPKHRFMLIFSMCNFVNNFASDGPGCISLSEVVETYIIDSKFSVDKNYVTEHPELINGNKGKLVLSNVLFNITKMTHRSKVFRFVPYEKGVIQILNATLICPFGYYHTHIKGTLQTKTTSVTPYAFNKLSLFCKPCNTSYASKRDELTFIASCDIIGIRCLLVYVSKILLTTYHELHTNHIQCFLDNYVALGNIYLGNAEDGISSKCPTKLKNSTWNYCSHPLRNNNVNGHAQGVNPSEFGYPTFRPINRIVGQREAEQGYFRSNQTSTNQDQSGNIYPPFSQAPDTSDENRQGYRQSDTVSITNNSINETFNRTLPALNQRQSNPDDLFVLSQPVTTGNQHLQGYSKIDQGVPTTKSEIQVDSPSRRVCSNETENSKGNYCKTHKQETGIDDWGSSPVFTETHDSCSPNPNGQEYHPKTKASPTNVTNSQNNYISFRIIHGTCPCMPCPYGGSCGWQTVMAKRDFWGIKRENTHHFFPCPPTYCCTEEFCDTYNKCSYNRYGILCGSCMENFTQAFFSSKCMPNDSCGNAWFFPLLMISISLYATFLMFQGDFLIFLFSKIPNPIKLYKICLRTSTQNIKEESNVGKGGMLVLLFSYFQDASLVHVNVPYTKQASSITVLKPLVGGLLKFRLDIFQLGFPDLCLIPGTSSVAIHGLRATCVPLLLGMIFVYFLVGKCLLVRKGQGIGSSIVTRSLKAMMLALMFSYQRVSSVTFTLLKCVYVLEDHVLLLDGNVTCYQTWQVLLMIFAIAGIIPFWIHLAIGPFLLRQGLIEYKEFYLSSIFPLPFVISWIFRLKTYSISSDNIEKRPTDSKALGKSLQDPYREICLPFTRIPLCWSGLLILRRLLLVLSSTFIIELMPRFLLMLSTAFGFLLMHSLIRPYKSKMGNITGVFESVALNLVCVINLLKASFEAAGYVPVRNALVTMSVLSAIEDVLMSWLPLVGATFIISLICIRLSVSVIHFLANIFTRSPPGAGLQRPEV